MLQRVLEIANLYQNTRIYVYTTALLSTILRDLTLKPDTINHFVPQLNHYFAAVNYTQAILLSKPLFYSDLKLFLDLH